MRIAALLILMLLAATIASAQTETGCDLDSLHAEIDSLIAVYQDEQPTVANSGSAVASARSLARSIDWALETCDQSAPDNRLGSGTVDSPYAYGSLVDTGRGFSIRITRVTRPADNIILNINPFNDAPGPDEEYVIVELEVFCHPERPRCDTDHLHFELVGSLGRIYRVPYLVYPNMLNLEVLGGRRITGDLVYLVKQDDDELRLIYRHDLFRPDMIVASADASLQEGIVGSALANINIRRGPSTEFPVVAGVDEDGVVIVIGRTADGAWVQTSQGWILAELLALAGDPTTLPITFQFE